MSTPALGCAQNADGSLRDATDIDFYEDVDSAVPIAGPSTDPSVPLHPLFTKRPLDHVAGSRRSSPRRTSRTSRPSARARDPNNAETATTGDSGKRKLLPAATGPRKAPKKALVAAAHADSSDSDSDTASVIGVDTDAGDTEGPDAMEVEEYETFKAMGDADHAHATAKVTQTSPTADIDVVFERKKGVKNPQTNVIEGAGATCLVCKRNGASTFLTGSVTTLRKHIARHKDHYSVYRKRCEALNIEMHSAAIPESESSVTIQGTLDAVVVAKPRPAPWTPEGLRDHLIEMIVTQDEVHIASITLNFVVELSSEGRGFHALKIRVCSTCKQELHDFYILESRCYLERRPMAPFNCYVVSYEEIDKLTWNIRVRPFFKEYLDDDWFSDPRRGMQCS